MLTLAADGEKTAISVTFGEDGKTEYNGLNIVPSGESDGEWETGKVELKPGEDGKPTITDDVGHVTKYMYFKIDTSTTAGKAIKAAKEVTFTFEYYDVGTNNMMFEFNGDPDNLISNTSNPAFDRLMISKGNTQELISTDVALTNCAFTGKQNAGADFRLAENPIDGGLYLKKVTVTLGVEDPTTDPAPTFAPETESNRMLGKSMAGYQAWFRASDNDKSGWNHWNGGSRPGAGSLSFEMWPDVSDYLEAGIKLYDTSFRDLGTGQSAQLFNSTDPEIIDTHFKWISEYGIGGFAVQRFYSATSSSNTSARNYLQTIQEKAEKYDKTYYIMYDLSGSGSDGEKALRQIKYDFIYNVERKGVASSTAYAHADGKPVVCLWGLDSTDPDRYPNAEVALDLVQWFQNRGYFVIGGIPENEWVDNTSDYAEVFASLDMLSPWMVGRMGQAEQLKRDSEWIEAHNTEEHTYYYQPVLYPGFSWANLKPTDEPNHIQRNAGQFLWTQALRAANYKMDSIYFAMFDEYDEGTAFMKAASDSFEVPEGLQYFLTLSADGKWLSSDFYLRAAGAVTKMVQQVAKGELAYEDVPAVIPIPHSLGPVYYRNGFEARYSESGTLAALDVGVSKKFNWLDDKYAGDIDLNDIKAYHVNELDELLGAEYGLTVSSSSVAGDYAALFDGKVRIHAEDGSTYPEISLAIGFSQTDILVEKGLSFEFNLMPLNENGTYTYMDLLFSDGTTLSDVQGGVIGRKAEIGKWTKVKLLLDDSLAGKTITEIVMGYNHVPSEDGAFAVLFDNITLEVADKDADMLQALVDSAENTIDGTYAAQYTAETVQAVETAIKAAKTVLGNDKATEAELTKAITDLAAAVKDLEKTEGIKGDVNGDGKVDTTDARLTLQHAVGKISLNASQQSAGDVNSDGKVDTTDARLILQYAVGKITKF